MSEAGDKVGAAIARHQQSIRAATETAELIANKRTKRVELDGGSLGRSLPSSSSATTEGDKS